MLNEQLTNIIKRELPYLMEHFGVKRIGLFGSFARGTPRSDSDVDILVEFKRPVGFKFMEFAGLQSIRVKRIAREIEESVVYV